MLKILLIEDSSLDAELMQAILIEGGIDCEIVRVETRAEFVATLEAQKFDLILSDYSLPAFDGIAALQLALNLRPEIPFIFVSATLGEELAIEMLKSGATDYVLKQRLGRLVPSIQRALRETQERIERQQAEAELHQSTVQLVHANQELQREITERKRAQEELAQSLKREQLARAEAEEASRIKDEFLAILSHELLNSAQSNLRLGTLAKKAKKLMQKKTAIALETIERNARLQAQLIEDLLDISQILQGKFRLNIQPVNLVSTIEAAIAAVHLAAEAKAIHLKFEIVDNRLNERDLSLKNSLSQIQLQNLDSKIQNLNFIVLGDKNRLQQVVWNLLTNAVKFTPQGGQVEVQLEQVESVGEQENRSVQRETTSTTSHQSIPPSPYHPYAHITVTDTGKGIKPSFLPYVFDYFRQADSTSTRAFGGLGLGLAIVRYLVELHGGTIWAESQGENQGATFTVKLPLIKSGVVDNS